MRMATAGATEKADARMQAGVSASRAGLVQTAVWLIMYRILHVLAMRWCLEMTAAAHATCSRGQCVLVTCCARDSHLHAESSMNCILTIYPCFIVCVYLSHFFCTHSHGVFSPSESCGSLHFQILFLSLNHRIHIRALVFLYTVALSL